MNLSTIIYVILIIGWFLFSFFKNMNKEEAERQAKKNRKPIPVDEFEEEVQPQPKRKKERVASPVFEQTAPQEEYFSYETMSERDFEKEFHQNAEAEIEVQHTSPQTHNLHLNLDDEEFYKGVIYSEILNKKY